MFAATTMLCKGPPKDLETVRSRYIALMDEFRAWGDRDEIATSADFEPVAQNWIDEVWQWLRDQPTVDDKLGLKLWNLLDEDEDGTRSLPELGFGPQLMLAVAALQAIARCSFPRHDDPSGEESSVPLSTELRAVASIALHWLDKGVGIGDDDEDSWQLPRASDG